MRTGNDGLPDSVAEALRMANASMDYLNGPARDDLDAASCGSVLRSLAEVQAKFTAAHAAVLARFDDALQALPLDIGVSSTIPAHIRRAVILRDQHCAWPGGCDVPAAGCDVHHLTHQKDGGPTSVASCRLFCNFHHDVCIHRWGWQIIVHPDGTSEAHSPDGHLILRSNSPPTLRAG